jgi:hypothetical protein
MSRRKRKPGRGDRPRPAEPRDPPAPRREPPKPNPPRPSKALLLVTSLLLAAWIAFLIILAVRTVS